MPEMNNLSGKIFILAYDSHRISANGFLTIVACRRQGTTSSRQCVEAETLTHHGCWKGVTARRAW